MIPSNENDIVYRLRLTPVIMRGDEFGWMKIDYELCRKYLNEEGSNLMREAAAEIERLRKENDDLKEIVALQGEVVKLAQRRHEERDEARRRYCYAMAEHGEEAEARQNAKDEGWDCFGENTSGK